VLPVRNGPIFGAFIGFIAGVLAYFGDLSISMIKRQFGVKDSGTFFRGHGGMLDRLDSLLFTLPFIHQSMLFYERFLSLAREPHSPSCTCARNCARFTSGVAFALKTALPTTITLAPE
jgi:hypothetical protein